MQQVAARSLRNVMECCPSGCETARHWEAGGGCGCVDPFMAVCLRMPSTCCSSLLECEVAAEGLYSEGNQRPCYNVGCP